MPLFLSVNMYPQKLNKNIVLTGFSATGKSTIARKVAERLNWKFIDTDEEIEKISGKSIPEIFEQDGENIFRKLEREVLRRACREEKAVIATGGGAIVNPKNLELIRQTGIVICLEAKPETIYQRLLHDSAYSSSPEIRPLLAIDNSLERISELKNYRQKYYAAADWTIHTDNLTPEEVSQEVIRGWQYISRHTTRNKKSFGSELCCQVITASATYPVFVGWGLLYKLGEKLKQTGLSGTANIVSDETVFSIWGDRVVKTLETVGLKVNCCVVPPGEATKNITQVIKIYDFLIDKRTERTDTIVALGGGMIGDLAGFVAATFLRGVPWLQVPTSLLAMADSSIGGKVAVDHPQGKNLIGAFYQPRLVLADVQTLTTLPQRELISGWAEVIKHGLVLDPNFFQLLEDIAEQLIKLEPDITSEVIMRSVQLKAQVVMEDEREAGRRIILNYGHTIAHGLEVATKYERFLHGEAVAIGMMGEARLSHRMGLLSQSVVKRLEAILQRFNLPTYCSGVAPTDILLAMELDKKVRGKAIQWVLLQDIGKVAVRNDIPEKEILNILQEVITP